MLNDQILAALTAAGYADDAYVVAMAEVHYDLVLDYIELWLLTTDTPAEPKAASLIFALNQLCL